MVLDLGFIHGNVKERVSVEKRGREGVFLK